MASYAAAGALVLLAAAGTAAISGVMGTSVSILFFPAVLFSAIYGGYGPALFATVLSTAILGYTFVTPNRSFGIGADDVVRLGGFAVIAMATASITAARKRAEDAQRAALRESRTALAALQKVSGWPVFVDVSIAGAASKLLAHAASVVQSERAIALWEAEDEPWMYLATSAAGADGVRKHPPAEFGPAVNPPLEDATFVSADPIGGPMRVVVNRGTSTSEWHGEPVSQSLGRWLHGRGLASAPFHVDRLSGRVLFSGLTDASAELVPLLEVVAREVGNSLERMHLHDELQQLVVREERIRVARDLHDGVLQSLTGIRLRLQALAESPEAASVARDSLLGVERAIAAEQRELRGFIEGLKPLGGAPMAGGTLAAVLDELRVRLSLEWNTPVTVRVVPDDLTVPPASEGAIRLLVREAVVNALKHAAPTRVAIDVAALPGARVQIVVANDGRGFRFQGRMEHEEFVATGQGPVSLRERLVSVGGSLAIESGAGGSRLEMTVPI